MGSEILASVTSHMDPAPDARAAAGAAGAAGVDDPGGGARLGPWALGAVYVAIAGLFLYPLVLILGEPYLLNYTEGILLHAAMQVQAGGSLYGDLSAPPHGYFAYGPLHALLGALLLALTGPSLLPLRLLSVACELAIVLLVYRTLRALRAGPPQDAAGAPEAGVPATGVPGSGDALAGAMLTLGVLGLHKFHGIVRVDMLMVAAEVWAVSELLMFLRGPGRGWRGLACFVAAMVLALLTKTTAAILLGGTGLVALLALCRQRRQGAMLLAAVAAAALVYGLVFLAWNAATGGGFARFQSTYQAASGFCDPRREDCFWVFNLFYVLLAHYGSFLALGLASVVLLRGGGALGLLALVSALWVCAGNFKSGADLNYNIELLVLLCMLVGLALPRWRGLAARLSARLAARLSARLAAACVALVVPALLAFGLASRVLAGYAIHDWNARSVTHPTREHTALVVTLMGGDPADKDLDRGFDLMTEQAREDRRILAALTRQAEGVLLAEEPLFAALAGKQVWVTDPFQTRALVEHGLMDLSPVLEACRSGRIRWVFAGWRLMMLPGLRELLETEFRPVHRTRSAIASSFWTVYVHRRAPPPLLP